MCMYKKYHFNIFNITNLDFFKESVLIFCSKGSKVNIFLSKTLGHTWNIHFYCKLECLKHVQQYMFQFLIQIRSTGNFKMIFDFYCEKNI